MDPIVKEFIVQRALSADEKFVQEIKNMTFKHIDSLLETKGEEYSQKVNRLENFLDGAAMDKETPEEALYGMVKKHWLSIQKFVREVPLGKRYDPVQWAEKTDDIITYMILLKVLCYKRFEVEAIISRKEARQAIEMGTPQRKVDAVAAPYIDPDKNKPGGIQIIDDFQDA